MVVWWAAAWELRLAGTKVPQSAVLMDVNLVERMVGWTALLSVALLVMMMADVMVVM